VIKRNHIYFCTSGLNLYLCKVKKLQLVLAAKETSEYHYNPSRKQVNLVTTRITSGRLQEHNFFYQLED